MKNVVIIDASVLMYRIAHRFLKFTTSKGIPSGMPFGIARAIRHLKTTYQPTQIIMVWDSWLKESQTIEGYKSGRVRTPLSEKVYEESENIAQLVRSMGVDNIKVPGYEADKIVGQWVLEHKITDTGNLHLLYTTDNDYLQLVEDNRVFVIKPPGRNKGATEIVYDEDSVLREFGVTVDKLLLYRAFEGDKSDKLPGVPRFNKEKLRMLTNLASTPEELVQKAGKVAKITETEYRKLQEHLPLAETNLGISAFQAGLVEDLDSYFDPGSWDEDKLRETFEHYELKSLLKLDLVDSFRIWDNMKLTSA